MSLALALFALAAAEPRPGARPAEHPRHRARRATCSSSCAPTWRPSTSSAVKTLAKEGFYNGIKFHRVIAGFMAQTGDPTGTGSGGSKLPDLPAEFTQEAFKRGSVGAARTHDPNSANSQFFICFGAGCRQLTGQYTLWGEVIEGMDTSTRSPAASPRPSPT